MKWHQKLSRRERQVMEILLSCADGATAADIQGRLPQAPSYSAVRALLRVMEEKGLLTHTAEGAAYVYRPAMAADQARASVLRQMLVTFFNGSREQLVAALLNEEETKISREELGRLEKLIRQAKREGR
jgi:predicted transcriptional regulator